MSKYAYLVSKMYIPGDLDIEPPLCLMKLTFELARDVSRKFWMFALIEAHAEIMDNPPPIPTSMKWYDWPLEYLTMEDFKKWVRQNNLTARETLSYCDLEDPWDEHIEQMLDSAGSRQREWILLDRAGPYDPVTDAPLPDTSQMHIDLDGRLSWKCNLKHSSIWAESPYVDIEFLREVCPQKKGD